MLIWGFAGQPEQFFSHLPKKFKHLGNIFPFSLRFWAEMELLLTFINSPKIFEQHKNLKNCPDVFMSIKIFPECPNVFEHKWKLKKPYHLPEIIGQHTIPKQFTCMVNILPLLNIWYVKIHSDPVNVFFDGRFCHSGNCFLNRYYSVTNFFFKQYFH
jgi:hypothetical protein